MVVVRISFVIPAFNEAATVGEVLERVERLGLEKQVIVVDDGSTDETGAIFEEWGRRHAHVVVVSQPNRGKGAAIRAAIPHIDGDVVVIQDADMLSLRAADASRPAPSDRRAAAAGRPRAADARAAGPDRRRAGAAANRCLDRA